jgi:hypothetical protein
MEQKIALILYDWMACDGIERPEAVRQAAAELAALFEREMAARDGLLVKVARLLYENQYSATDRECVAVCQYCECGPLWMGISDHDSDCPIYQVLSEIEKKYPEIAKAHDSAE